MATPPGARKRAAPRKGHTRSCKANEKHGCKSCFVGSETPSGKRVDRRSRVLNAEPRLSRPGRSIWTATAGTRLRTKPQRGAAAGDPSPAAKDGGIGELQSVRWRCTRLVLASRKTPSFLARPTDPAARPPRAQWSRRSSDVPEKSVLRRSSASCGRESNPRQTGYAPVALPSELPRPIPPRFKFPARNTPCQTSVKTWPERTAGPTGPAASITNPATRVQKRTAPHVSFVSVEFASTHDTAWHALECRVAGTMGSPVIDGS